jgi:Arc/MetJ family transcription regulator
MTAYDNSYFGYSGVPEDAAEEVMDILLTRQQISSDELAQILKRYGICGDPEALQTAYRKKVGQRLIASLRDPYGRREVFSTGNTYVLVECCNDRDALECIHEKLGKDMEAVDQASGKIDNRLQVLRRFARFHRKKKGGKAS